MLHSLQCTVRGSNAWCDQRWPLNKLLMTCISVRRVMPSRLPQGDGWVTWYTRCSLCTIGPPRGKQLVITAGPVIPCRRAARSLRGGPCCSIDDSPLAVDEGLEVGTTPAEDVCGVLQQVALPPRSFPEAYARSAVCYQWDRSAASDGQALWRTG